MGRDRFVLGDRDRLYYSDGDPLTTGEYDYALITDFNPNKDFIQLHGPVDFYSLDFYTTSSGIVNVALTYDPGVSARRELIGVIEAVSPSLTLSAPAFNFL